MLMLTLAAGLFVNYTTVKVVETTVRNADAELQRAHTLITEHHSALESEAHAQALPGYYSPQLIVDSTINSTSTNQFTNYIAVSTAFTPAKPYRIDCTQGKDLCLEFSSQCAASNGATALLMLGRSVSPNATGPTNYERWTWTVTLNGTTRITVNTNIGSVANGAVQLGAVPYIWLEYITNLGTVAGGSLTNYTLRAYNK